MASTTAPSCSQPLPPFITGHYLDWTAALVGPRNFLAVHRLAIGSGLWETVSMAIAKIKAGQIVVSDGLVGVYRVVAVSPDGKMADVEKFDVSKQKSLGDPVRSIAVDKLTAYKEDATQAAARIVREATTED